MFPYNYPHFYDFFVNKNWRTYSFLNSGPLPVINDPFWDIFRRLNGMELTKDIGRQWRNTGDKILF